MNVLVHYNTTLFYCTVLYCLCSILNNFYFGTNFEIVKEKQQYSYIISLRGMHRYLYRIQRS